MKPLKFMGSSREDLQEFPVEARKEAGFELHAVQCGMDPSDWKPMQSVGPGVREIRIRLREEYRVIYIASIADAVYVLHAFQKKTRKTSTRDIELAKARFKGIERN